MRADICDPDNLEAVKRFKEALGRLGATRVNESFALGVDLLTLRIGAENLVVFSDPWSIDIEGPESLVRLVLQTFNNLSNGNE